MELENYRDISRKGMETDAGFQFEFFCEHCARTWKSPFRPYRMGQIAGLLHRFAFYFGGDKGSASRAAYEMSEMRSDKNFQDALRDAQQQAEGLFHRCPKCSKVACESCWDDRRGRCEPCTLRESGGAGAVQAAAASATGALKCPNCQGAMGGGRFCAECGYDMASTHKSCPTCGAMCLRQTRFCTDCGHGF
jgi:hypothetical protein